MPEITVEYLEQMSIIQLIQFIEERGEKIIKFELEFEKYFKKLKPASIVPYYYYNLYVDLSAKDKYNMLSDYISNVQPEDRIKLLELSPEYCEIYHLDLKVLRNIRNIYSIRNNLYDFFRFEGNLLFLIELFEKGLFDSGDAQVLLERYISTIHWSRYKYNDDIILALALFLKDKDENLQMILGDILFKYVDRSERILEPLLFVYKHGSNYVKRGAIHIITKLGGIIHPSTNDLEAAKEVLDIVADDLEGDDLVLRNLIISFIEYFDMIQDEISQHLKEEKGILYSPDMIYDAWYDKAENIQERLKSQLDNEEKKKKEKNN
ncbi:MAG: hypothetical protein ACW96U_05440 [Candidatus Heimdallarchaeaceae archaeon]|jgi:hypothetical protein